MASRPPPRPTAGRSPPPSSPPPPPAPSSSRPMGKIVRIPRTGHPSTTATTFVSINAGGSVPRPVVATTGGRIPVRKRPSPSPPRESVVPEQSEAVATVNTSRSAFGWQRENPNPNPPPPSAVGGPRVWKRRRPTNGEADPPPPPQSKPEDPDLSDQAPETTISLITPQEETKPPESTVVQVDDASVKNPDRAMETATEPAVEEGEVEPEETAFDRAIVESEEMMVRSTAWIGEALNSILSDVAKVAEKEKSGEKGQLAKLGDLLRLSIDEMLEPGVKHVEVIGDVARWMEVEVERLRENRIEQIS